MDNKPQDPHSILMESIFDENESRFVSRYTHRQSGRTFNTKGEALDFVQSASGKARDTIQTAVQVTNPLTGSAVSRDGLSRRPVRMRVWGRTDWETLEIEVLDEMYFPKPDEDSVAHHWEELSHSGAFLRTSASKIFGLDDGDSGTRLYAEVRGWHHCDGETEYIPYVFVDILEDSDTVTIGASLGIGWASEIFAILPRSEVSVATGLAVSLGTHLSRGAEVAWAGWREELDLLWG